MYSTIFEGKMKIELKEQHLNALQGLIPQNLKEQNLIVVDEISLKVNGEWNDRGLMENLILFIGNYGTLKSGKIRCFGEDPKDVWDIIISDQKAYIKEIGSRITWTRAGMLLETKN